MVSIMRLTSCAALATLAVADRGGEATAKNPVRKVVTLLQNMAKKIEAEGEQEKELFEKFNCFCKNGESSLSESISSNDAKVPAVQSDIEEGTAEEAQLKLDLKQHQTDRAAAEKNMAEATAIREKEHAEFLKENAETTSYIKSMTMAINAIESGMSGTKLLQTNSAAIIRRAISNDDQLSEDDRDMVFSFLSNKALNFDGYVPKSGEIVGILKEILDNYQKTQADFVADEKDTQTTYDELMRAKGKEVKVLSKSIETKTARVGNLAVDLIKMKQEMTEAEAQLVQDKEMLGNLGANCAKKNQEFEDRVKLRGEELVAVHDTIGILNDDDALELFKKTLPGAGSFMQMAPRHEAMRLGALSMVQRITVDESKPQIKLLQISLKSRKVDFSKVLKMIDDMVTLLEQEQMDDDHKKEYCTRQLDVIEDKAKELQKTIDALDTDIEERKERLGALAQEIKDAQKSIKDLDRLVVDETEQRKHENEEFTELMGSNTAAKELLEFAKNRLNKFYNPKLYKDPKAETALTEETVFAVPSFLQEAQDPDEAPPTWEGERKKDHEGSSGVVGMIDTLIRDLSLEMKEAETEEKDAQKDYEEFMADSAKKRAKDAKAIEIKQAATADAENQKMASEASKGENTDELMATVAYQGQLHKECDWLLQNFDLRKTARADERDNLKKAKAVLSGADFSLLQAAGPRAALLSRHRF